MAETFVDPAIFSSHAVLDFWFVETPKENHFKKDEKFDETIRQRFGDVNARAQAGDYDGKVHGAKEKLALIIVLDQFSRNLYRDTALAFAGDARALALTEALLRADEYKNFSTQEKFFLYMPLEHSEDLARQELSVRLFTALGNSDYAVRHYDIIKRFGRFPHRNQALARASTPEELEFLKQPNSSF